MPIPTPNKGEKRTAFINRCMGNPTMVKEYPKQEQRAGVCHSQWRRNLQFEPPESGDLPAAGKKILTSAYSSCRTAWIKDHPKDKENQGNKESCARIAWTAVKKAGYIKRGGKWIKKEDVMSVRYIKENGRIYRIDGDEDTIDEEIRKLLSLAGALAVEEKESDWYRVTNAAHRLINRILNDTDMDKKKKISTINKVIEDMPAMLKKRIAAVVAAYVGDTEEWEVMAALASINDMMVFRTGEHNGHKYTDEDIEEIAANFKALKDIIRPKLKITHEEDQKKVAGLASYGDIVAVVVKAIKNKAGKMIKHLFVKVTSVPGKVAQWINDRRFPERSVEIWPKIRVNGKIYKNVLRNVSMLGHQPPAVPGMTPVRATGDDFEFNTVALAFEGDDEEIDVIFEAAIIPKGGEEQMQKTDVTDDVAKLQDAITTLEENVTAKTDEIAKMKNESDAERLRAEKTDLETKLADAREQVTKFQKLEVEAKEGKVAKDELVKLKSDTRRDLIANSIEILKKGGHVLPKEEPVLKALMESFGDVVIKLKVLDEDGKQKDLETSQVELLNTILQARKHEAFEEVSIPGDGNKPRGVHQNDAGELKTLKFDAGDRSGQVLEVKDEGDLDSKARAFMKEHKDATYEEALIAVG